MVDDTVRARLLGVHDEVAVRVVHDLLERLLRVEREDLGEPLLDAQDLLRLDGDVGGLSLRAAPWLVDQDASADELIKLSIPSSRGGTFPIRRHCKHRVCGESHWAERTNIMDPLSPCIEGIVSIPKTAIPGDEPWWCGER